MSDDEKIVYEITVDLPDSPPGELVQIPGLGTFENDSTHDVTEEQAQAYRTYHSQMVMVTNDETHEVTGELQQGATLLQAASNMYGVEVTTKKESKSTPTPPKPADEDKNKGGDN